MYFAESFVDRLDVGYERLSQGNFKVLGLGRWKIERPLTRTGRLQEEQVCKCSGHVKFEMPTICPVGYVE